MEWQQTIAAYGAAWQEPNAEARLELLNTCFAENGRYVDPTADVTSRAALNDHIGNVLTGSDGTVELTSQPTNHHDVVHFTWHMTGPDGSIYVSGHDFVHLDAEGKIVHLAGFFGDPEPLN
ncbi:nuclear transport factor 2 family protein [Ruegeria sp. ANG-S4]|uniref:nuclear transport factor 2 family protein n=1 Tax=Ruegeria sp. ANG-S4 TaxID=1577904 RepID=UPI000690F6C8|nr:nuclear transport factor 2 family protein [Ruegeria sp. ANG-S4]